MNLSSLGHKFKLKFKLSRNLELQSVKLTRFYCSLNLTFQGKMWYTVTSFFAEEGTSEECAAIAG
jgi:hypothetical protein